MRRRRGRHGCGGIIFVEHVVTPLLDALGDHNLMVDATASTDEQVREVTVDARAMSRGLAQSGHIALYGIRFASNSALLEKSSDGALAQMAALLKAQPALKLFIVGHTDDSGSLAYNLTLSRQRAESVTHALVKRYGIPPARLAATGLASYEPVASNRDGTGKAKNRRIELVEQ